jgi:hypothetical protein
MIRATVLAITVYAVLFGAGILAAIHFAVDGRPGISIAILIAMILLRVRVRYAEN